MQLLYLTEKWYRALERGKNVTAVFLDFQKAFDRVWHHGLLHQLTALCISPRSLTWLTSYLSDRSITVRVGSTCSEHKSISSGVPQLTPKPSPVHYLHQHPDTHCLCPNRHLRDDTTLHHEHSPRAPACPSYQELQEAKTAQKTGPNRGTESSGKPKPGICQQAKTSSFKHLHPQSTDSREGSPTTIDT